MTDLLLYLAGGGWMMSLTNNMNIVLFRHAETSQEIIDQIIGLKMQHWPYPYEKQQEWLKTNIENHDFHLLITDENHRLIAYMNLVFRKANEKTYLGIGNVCVDRDHLNRGLGLLLVNAAKYFAKSLAMDLILLCKKPLVSFYEKCGFHLYQGMACLHGTPFTESVMSSTIISDKELYIDKSF